MPEDYEIHERCAQHSGQASQMKLIIFMLSTVLALTGFNLVLTFNVKGDVASYTFRFSTVERDINDLKESLRASNRTIDSLHADIDKLKK